MDTIVNQEEKTLSRSPTCLVHFKDETGPLTCFTKTSFEKFLISQEQWIKLDGEHQKIAEKTSDVVRQVKSQDQPLPTIQNLYYHRKCYSKFTNVTLIKRAQSRCSKQSVKAETENEIIPQKTSHENSFPPKKLLRSDQSSSFKSRNKHVLPPVCLICQKEDTYVTDQVSTSFFELGCSLATIR